MKIRDVDQQRQGLSTFGLTDIVFLLLVFFLVTFKIVESEGDFNVHMELGTSDGPIFDLPLTLSMMADEAGELTSMSLNELELGADFDKLRSVVVSIVSSSQLTQEMDVPEIEIATDYNLQYSFVVQAITAVSGYKDGDQTVR